VRLYLAIHPNSLMNTEGFIYKIMHMFFVLFCFSFFFFFQVWVLVDEARDVRIVVEEAQRRPWLGYTDEKKRSLNTHIAGRSPAF
jgi:hypothetical protein